MGIKTFFFKKAVVSSAKGGAAVGGVVTAAPGFIGGGLIGAVFASPELAIPAAVVTSIPGGLIGGLGGLLGTPFYFLLNLSTRKMMKDELLNQVDEKLNDLEQYSNDDLHILLNNIVHFYKQEVGLNQSQSSKELLATLTEFGHPRDKAQKLKEYLQRKEGSIRYSNGKSLFNIAATLILLMKPSSKIDNNTLDPESTQITCPIAKSQGRKVVMKNPIQICSTDNTTTIVEKDEFEALYQNNTNKLSYKLPNFHLQGKKYSFDKNKQSGIHWVTKNKIKNLGYCSIKGTHSKEFKIEDKYQSKLNDYLKPSMARSINMQPSPK